MKSPFDHVNAIQTDKRIEYFDELEESERKAFPSYMIHRILSMNPEYIEVVNEFQRYHGEVGPREVYLFYSQIIPKGRKYSKYVKGKKESKFDEVLVDAVRKYHQVSTNDAIYYISILIETPEGREALLRILKFFGIDGTKLVK